MNWATAASMVVLLVFVAGPEYITDWLYGCFIPSRPWTVFFICLGILNWKGLPLAWHLRVFRTLIFPVLSRASPPATSSKDLAIFTKFTTSSRSPLWECDFMGHKSNSSYSSDLDIARSDLIARLLAGGMLRLPKEQAEGDEETPTLQHMVLPIMGGATTAFHREIAPHQAYSMETRILCWDQKWIYVLTQFVAERKGKEEICATAVMKLVFKSGKITVRPEVLFRVSGLLVGDEKSLDRIEHYRLQGFKVAERCFSATDLMALVKSANLEDSIPG